MSDNKIQTISEYLIEDAVKSERKEIIERLQWIRDIQIDPLVERGLNLAIAIVERRGLVPVPPPVQGESDV